MNYQINNGQSIFDVVINTVLDLNNTYQLLQGNPAIVNIAAKPTGVVVDYSPPPITPPTVSVTPAIVVSAANFISRNNQTVYDIALQTYGGLDLTYKLIQDSGFKNINTYPLAKTPFAYNPTMITDVVFNNYLTTKGIIFNTGSINKSVPLYKVYGHEDLTEIYESEDGTNEYTPES
jgi:hypothetical protein